MVPRLSEAWDEVGFPRAAPSRVIRAINSPSLGMNGLTQGRKITAPAEPGGWNSLFPVLFPAPCSAQAFLVGNSHEFGLKFRVFQDSCGRVALGILRTWNVTPWFVSYLFTPSSPSWTRLPMCPNSS